VESEDTGKPYESMSLNNDVAFSVDNLKFFAAAARSTAGTAAGDFLKGYTSILRRQPVGVVGQITPWNTRSTWRCGRSGALAAGAPSSQRHRRHTLMLGAGGSGSRRRLQCGHRGSLSGRASEHLGS
jgi:acyl-CoA reductase-like NAD-dependent aldehyde dehydrogenase